MSKRKPSAASDRIDAAYNKTCNGIQIRIMDISKVFKQGQLLIDQGADDAVLQAGILAYVQTIRVND